MNTHTRTQTHTRTHTHARTHSLTHARTHSRTHSLSTLQLDYRQLGFVLGLMGQAQRGEELDPAVIGPESEPPTLDGLPPMEEDSAA